MNKPDRDENELCFFKGMKAHNSNDDYKDDWVGVQLIEGTDDFNVSAYSEEVNKARDRIGVEAKNKIQWLLNIASFDLPKISAGDWVNLKFEFFAFQTFDNPFLLALQDLKVATHPTRKDIELFHLTIKKGLERLIDEKKIVFDIESLRVIIRPYMKGELANDNTGDFEPWNVMSVSADKWSVSQYNLSALIGKFAHLIRCCPECNKFFLADRKNQSYCSLKHQNYAAGKKYRKSKGLITGRPVGRPRKIYTPKKEGGS